ncbi:MAG TPA: glycosyltransferase family 2 protein [Gemmatimonadales bacterium]|nr:glycosyltransferase family 2 protein [Gemmatimonadales bacterium]
MPFPDLAAALPWLAPFAGLARLAVTRPNLSDVPPVTGTPVTVVIPARNEAGAIETVVRSILASTYHPFELIVVDDRSTDDTAAVVTRLAAGEPRLRLVRGAALPDGWYGKPWACAQGAAAGSGTLLLFTDADTRHAPELLGRSVAAMRREGADLVTVSPHQRCVTFWERLIMPQIWLLLGLRYHPRRVNRATRERDVIANGQFILTTREAYDAVGTHAAVRHEVAEDLALAQAYLRQGRRLHFAFAERLMETRMYQNLSQLVEGWSKNIYLGGKRSFPEEPALRALAPLMLLLALVFWLIPPAAAVMSALGSDAFQRVMLPALVASGISACFWSVLSYGMKIPPAYGMLYPLGATMALYIAARSFWRGERRVEWRGRVYGTSAPGPAREDR